MRVFGYPAWNARKDRGRAAADCLTAGTKSNVESVIAFQLISLGRSRF
jgi:hypothetical protein